MLLPVPVDALTGACLWCGWLTNSRLGKGLLELLGGEESAVNQSPGIALKLYSYLNNDNGNCNIF